MITPAEISEFQVDGREYLGVRIGELGKYSVPEWVIQRGPLKPRVLDVVSLQVSTEPGEYLLEARGSMVTSELLSADVRLDIAPKFGFDGLAALLAWSSHSVVALQERAPIDIEPGLGLVEVFADRFLDEMQPVLANGWIPQIVRTSITSPEVRGDVDLLSSYDHIYRSGRLTLDQTVNELSWQHAANRVVRSTLIYLHYLRRSLSRLTHTRVLSQLAASTSITVFESGPKQALRHCEDILRKRPLDASRNYFYPACTAARPILQSLSWGMGGSPEVEDTPFRVNMPDTVEQAIRNVTSHAAGVSFVARKEKTEHLYVESDPDSFDPTLEPDIVIRPISDMRRCLAVFDVKYKEQPSPADHYQLSAYARAYGASACAFITVSDDLGSPGVVANATARDELPTYEYAVPAGTVRRGLSNYAAWVQQLVRGLA